MEWTRGHAIGQGSSATVYLATSLRSGDVFAAKSAELYESKFLQREQKFLSSLNSPHVITYKGYDITSENNKSVYNLFTEYAPGGTLTDEIRKNGGRLMESIVVCHTRRILQGLEYLHSNGVVHCDIKSRNILITGSGAKIADFGCARWKSEAVGSGGGTPMFMAPEVARGEHQAFASDIWAVGCTIIEMASGGAPWPDATDPVTVLYKIAYSSDLPEFPALLSEQAKDFLSNCLRRDPNERWAAGQLLKHPFLLDQEELISYPKKNQESNNSPTSVLDHRGIWNSVEEETEERLGVPVHSITTVSACERIKRLSCSQMPSWDDSNGSWITIRESNNEETSAVLDEIEAGDDTISCGSVLGSINGRCSSISDRTSKDCRTESDVIVISSNLSLQRHTDSLLSFPLISTTSVF